jgi:argininosuccinate lyase
MLGILKGLPLAYQRDLQEGVPPLFGAVAALEAALPVMGGLVETLAIDAGRMRAAADEGFTTATAVADALVRHGVAFRSAHHVVGALVAAAEARGIGLDAVADGEVVAALRGVDDAALAALVADPGIGVVVRAAASVEGALAAADVSGGTAPGRVRIALAEARRRVGT